jgi:hypothetical protein
MQWASQQNGFVVSSICSSVWWGLTLQRKDRQPSFRACALYFFPVLFLSEFSVIHEDRRCVGGFCPALDNDFAE